MMIKPITEESQLKAALALVWQVFSQFEAPDYSDEGIQEFKEYLDLEDMKQRLETKQLSIWGAERAGKLVGVIALRPPAHVSLLFVAAEYHRQGIAKQLYQTILADGDYATITVNSSPYAFPVYQRLGFVATDKEQIVNGIRFIPMVHKVKKASPNPSALEQ